MKRQILTINEMAKYLKISPSSVYKLARSGEIPAFKVLNKWRFEISAIDELIRKQYLDVPQTKEETT